MPGKRSPEKRQGGPPQTVHSQQRAQRIEAEQRALTLRIAGASYDQIAQSLGLQTRSAAYKMIERVLARMVQEPSDKVRALELARLDDWLMRIAPRIHQGELAAIDTGLRIMGRRAALLGLDLPVKVDLHLQIEAIATRVAQQIGLTPEAVLAEACLLLKELDYADLSRRATD